MPAIVVTENAFRFIASARHRPARPRRVTETVLEATRQVGRPIFFSLAIIVLSFVPVFVLAGQEGKLFHPLAFTKTFSMMGSTLLAVTLVPVLCSLLIGGKIRGGGAQPGHAAAHLALPPDAPLGAADTALMTLGWRGPRLGRRRCPRPAHRQGVHAAPERGRSSTCR